MIRLKLALAILLCVFISLGVPSLPANAAPIDQSSWNSLKKEVQLPNGIRLSYRELGNPDGRPLLLLHGYTDSSRAWSTVAPLLADYRLLIPDQRGHGRSEAPACCYAIVNFANDAKLFLDVMGVKQAAVAGHSLGSIVAMRLAAEHPERVTGLILVGSTALTPVKRGDWLWTSVAALREPILSNTEFLAQWSAGAGPVPVDPVFVRYSDADVAAVPPHVWHSVMRELVELPVGRFAVDVRAPVLILSGGRDQLFPPEHHAALLEAYPNAEARIFPTLGHNLVWEDPKGIAMTIDRFLNESATRYRRLRDFQ